MVAPVTSPPQRAPTAEVPRPGLFLRSPREAALADKVWTTFRDVPNAFELQSRSDGQWRASLGYSRLQCHPFQMAAIGAVRVRTGDQYVFPTHVEPIRFAPDFLARVDELRSWAKHEGYTRAELANVAHFFQAAQNNAAYGSPIARGLLVAWELGVSPVKIAATRAAAGKPLVDAWSDAWDYNVRQYEQADLPGHRWGQASKDVLCGE